MIPDQHNYLLALRGVGRIVDLFLHIGGSKVSLYFFYFEIFIILFCICFYLKLLLFLIYIIAW